MAKGRLLTILLMALVASYCAPPKRTGDPYTIKSDYSLKCLSLILPGGYYDKDPAQQWACNHIHMGLQGSWYLEPVNGGSIYTIVSIHSGKCLEVDMSNGGKNNGDLILQNHCNGADNQKWEFKNVSGGINTIGSVQSGKCMEAKVTSSGTVNDGDSVHQWDCNNSKQQIWLVEKTNAPNPPLDTFKGELCNVCNPLNPVCKTGAMCLVTTSGQNICGQSCSTSSPCPQGYSCTKFIKAGQTVFQCVPINDNCPR